MKTRNKKGGKRKRRTRIKQRGGRVEELRMVQNYKDFAFYMDTKIKNVLDFSKENDFEQKKIDNELNRLRPIISKKTLAFADNLPKNDINEISESFKKTIYEHNKTLLNNDKLFLESIQSKFKLNFYRLPETIGKKELNKNILDRTQAQVPDDATTARNELVNSIKGVTPNPLEILRIIPASFSLLIHVLTSLSKCNPNQSDEDPSRFDDSSTDYSDTNSSDDYDSKRSSRSIASSNSSDSGNDSFKSSDNNSSNSSVQSQSSRSIASSNSVDSGNGSFSDSANSSVQSQSSRSIASSNSVENGSFKSSDNDSANKSKQPVQSQSSRSDQSSNYDEYDIASEFRRQLDLDIGNKEKKYATAIKNVFKNIKIRIAGLNASCYNPSNNNNKRKTYLQTLRQWEVVCIQNEKKEEKNSGERSALYLFMDEANKMITEKIIKNVIEDIKEINKVDFKMVKRTYKAQTFFGYLKTYVDELNKKFAFDEDFFEYLRDESEDGYQIAEYENAKQESDTSTRNDLHKTMLDIIVTKGSPDEDDTITSVLKLYADMLRSKNGGTTMKGGKMKDGTVDKKKPRELIAYLNSNNVTNQINIAAGDDDKMKKDMFKRRALVVDTLKKQVSENHVDYEIDNFLDLFFPKATKNDALPPKEDELPKVYETKEELITNMYSYPIDADTFGKKGDANAAAKQEGNPFGFDINVLRSDSGAWDQMMGVETFLLALNASGANTNYFSEYYKDPMFTNKVTTTKRIPNFAHTGLKL